MDDDVFGSIATGFAQYATDSFVHIVGSAESIDPDSRIVFINHAPRYSIDFDDFDGEGSAERHEIKYDQIILCTGTRAADPEMPWKNMNTTDETRELLHITQRKVEKARHIVIGGAGATGVEVAGELGYEYAKAKENKRKEIVLVCKDPHLVGGHAIAHKVEIELAKLGVKVVKNARVLDKHTKEGKTFVHLSNGQTLETDLYLSCMGLFPNSEYLPAEYKDDRGYVLVDEYFRVREAPGMWACGDIVSKPRAAFVYTEKHAAGVAFNVENVLRNKDLVKVKGLPFDPFVVSLGRKRGAGKAGRVTVPSYGVYWVKGRNLGMTRLQGYLHGSSW